MSGYLSYRAKSLRTRPVFRSIQTRDARRSIPRVVRRVVKVFAIMIVSDMVGFGDEASGVEVIEWVGDDWK
jgi:hypothetical protein